MLEATVGASAGAAACSQWLAMPSVPKLGFLKDNFVLGKKSRLFLRKTFLLFGVFRCQVTMLSIVFSKVRQYLMSEHYPMPQPWTTFAPSLEMLLVGMSVSHITESFVFLPLIHHPRFYWSLADSEAGELA